MKTFLIIACFIVLTVADDFFMKAAKECVAATAVSSDALNNRDITDAKYQKFSECMLTKFTILNNGIIDMTTLKEAFKKGNIDYSFLDDCAQKKGDSKGEDYAVIFNCMLTNWPKK